MDRGMPWLLAKAFGRAAPEAPARIREAFPLYMEDAAVLVEEDPNRQIPCLCRSQERASCNNPR